MFSNSNVQFNVVTHMQAMAANLRSPPLVSDPLTESLGLNCVDFAYHQSKCNSLSEIRKQVDDEAILTVKNRKIQYVKVGNLIYRKCIDSKNVADINNMQLVVPVEYRKYIMKLAHESLLSGHFSSRKTTDKIFQKFYCPRLELVLLFITSVDHVMLVKNLVQNQRKSPWSICQSLMSHFLALQ